MHLMHLWLLLQNVHLTLWHLRPKRGREARAILCRVAGGAE